MLSPEDVEKVRLVLHSGGWNDVMRPALLRRGAEAMKALVMSRTERADRYAKSDFNADDDVLRAIVRDVEWMSSAWLNEILVADHNRRLDELQNTPAEQ